MTHLGDPAREGSQRARFRLLDGLPELFRVREVACISNFDRRESVWRMKTIGLSDAEARLSEIVDDLRRDLQDVAIEKHGESVAVLVEVRRYQRLRELDDAVMRLELKRALRGRKYRLEDVLDELSAQ